MIEKPQKLITSYFLRHGLGMALPGDDGRVTIIVDDTYRVHLQATVEGWLAVTARLCSMPLAGRMRDQLVLAVGELAAGMLGNSSASCVIDPQERALWLQHSLRPDSADNDVDEAVGAFINALSFWVDAIRGLV
jgi:hypothetical protein